jgi:beta-glucanase (GH16 family)
MGIEATNLGTTVNSLIRGTPDIVQPMDSNKSGWEKRSGANNDPFNCTFSPANILFNNGVMALNLSKINGAYVSGEYRTEDEKYSFGYYETRMKAAKGAGLVGGTFFTYAGVWGQKSHNEIDFEVLGKDPTQVQLNYYYAGTGTHEKMIDLGFDASKDFHNYGFHWTKNSIEWYIDGKQVYKATENIPQKPCRIMVNMWPGTSSVEGWLGGVYEGNGTSAQYDWIKYLKEKAQNAGTPANEPANKPIKSEPAENTSENDSIINEFIKKEPDLSVPADNIKGEQLFNSLVLSRGAFNGASGGLIGDKIKLIASNSTDAGLFNALKSPVEGRLMFNHKGKVTGGYRDGGFTVIFIKQGPGGNYKKDEQIGEESVIPSKDLKEASVEIPPGTDKINFMLVGKGSVNVEITNVRITK